MKRLLLLLLTLATLSLHAQQIELVSQTETAITLRCQIDGIDFQSVATEQGEAVRIVLNDATPLLKTGAPEIPKLTASYILDRYETGKVQVETISYTDYEEVLLVPSKGNLFRDVNPADVPYEFGEIYQEDAFFPKKMVELRTPHIFRDFRAQTALFFPVRYNPAQQLLRVAEEIVVTIELKENPEMAEAANQRASMNTPEPYHLLYQKRYLNYQNESRYEQVGELGNMLIITTADFIPQIEDFVRWKNQKGIPTQVVDVAETGATPSAVRQFVDEYYLENGITYLLIIGDENRVPTQQTSQQNACDHCYSYQAGDDHYPEFFVGRFNAENAEQLQTMLDRNMLYETNPGMDNPNWFSTALGMGSAEGPGDDGEYDFEHLNNIKMELLNYGFTEVYEFYDGDQSTDSPTPGDVTSDGTGYPNGEMINEVINAGATLINYTGHGDHGVLASGNYNNAAINQLTNYGAYPFLIAVACCVGDFQNDFGSGPCLGDVWTRATDDATGLPAGGIGGCFSSILQSWAPPMEGQDEMTKLLTEAAVYDIRHTMGSVVVHGSSSMIDDYGNDGETMMDTWNIFGDPSVLLWTQTPEAMEVQHVNETFIGATQLEVSCDVEDALVGLYHQGRNIAYGAVSGGVATLDFDALQYPSPITVTVTAYNHLPYQGEIQVVPLEGPFVVISEYEIDDTNGGNADQKVDYSETIELNITLENVGLDTARAVQTVISTTSEEVSIMNDTHVWGDIAEDEVFNQAAAFTFSVAEYIEDQLVVPFLLTTEDADGHTWTRNIPVTINAPVLNLGEITLDDSNNGNGNGRLEPGEEALLIINNLNTGHSTSPTATAMLSTTSPYLEIQSANLLVGAIESEAMAVYSVTVSEDVPLATIIPLQYHLQAGPYEVTGAPALTANLIVEEFETEVLDEELFGWSNTGDYPWFITTNAPYAGQQCLQSANIDDNNTSIVEMELTTIEDGTFSFAQRVSSEASYDFLKFYIDYEEMGSWSGIGDWEEVSYEVPAGEHTFTWAYEKDVFVSNGEDAAWIDDIILPPFEMPEDSTINSTNTLVKGINRLEALPNLTRDLTIISYELTEHQRVSLQLVNSQGILLETIAEAQLQPKAVHQHKLNLEHYPAGLYYILLRGENGVLTRRVVKQ